MSIEERIKYAESKRDEALDNGTFSDVIHWNGYIEGIKAVQRDLNNG
jgi:hypothetical protein